MIFIFLHLWISVCWKKIISSLKAKIIQRFSLSKVITFSELSIISFSFAIICSVVFSCIANMLSKVCLVLSLLLSVNFAGIFSFLNIWYFSILLYIYIYIYFIYCTDIHFSQNFLTSLQKINVPKSSEEISGLPFLLEK